RAGDVETTKADAALRLVEGRGEQRLGGGVERESGVGGGVNVGGRFAEIEVVDQPDASAGANHELTGLGGEPRGAETLDLRQVGERVGDDCGSLGGVPYFQNLR